LYVKGKQNHELGTRPFVHKRIIPAAKRVEFVSYRVPYIIQRGRWCDAIVLNIHAPKERKIDDMEDSLSEEVECEFGISVNAIQNSVNISLTK
jgi:hypothetical protein